MEMKWLRTFVLAASELNYRKTAEQLYITQPAVSLHIKQLEEELQESLFIKKGRHIQLTEFGRMFRGEAMELLQHYDSAIQRVYSLKQGYRKTLTIGITPLLVDSIFPSVVRRFQEKYQDIELAIQVAESSQLQNLVESDRIDIAFSCLPSFNGNLFCEKLFEDRINLVTVHDGYDFESAPAFDSHELLNQSIIFTDHHPSYWDRLKREIQRHVASPNFLKVTQSYATKRFILEGMGISFLPAFAVSREIKEGRMLMVDTPFFNLPHCSIHTLYKYDHFYEEEFLNFVNQFLFTNTI
ncbi:LysR family transcriptional regulator [Halobacillus shinanisalinarum]|uniref:LysR family transcriptional regulator n=1 Tax=Halobacillus shinanisalinarum TaxID=2932258 RepID=A0ABY4H1G4_9BACI|nr:LysR family transcriptional regulator [Halobacillus shinanisalinarum]UOQ93482.1 LysR family transcriptional regulator [Halobacillus shinanisalinarum]